MLSDFSRRVGTVGAGRLFYVASLTLFHVVLARTMGPVVYGGFQRVWLFSGLFLLFLFGIPESLYYFLPRSPDKEVKITVLNAAFVSCFFACLLFFIIWISSPFLARHYNDPSLVFNLRLFSIYGAMLVLSVFIDPVFITYHRARYHAIINIIHGIFLLLLAGYYYQSHIPLLKVFYFLIICGVLRLFLTAFFVRMVPFPDGSVRGRLIRPDIMRKIILYAIPIGFTAGLEVIARWLDKIVVSVFFDRATLAVYTVGAMEIPAVGVFLSSVTSVLLPYLNRLDHEGNVEGFIVLWRNVIQRTASIIWPVFIWLFLFAGPLIELVFSSEYLRSVAPFRIYLLMLPLRVAVFSAVVYSIGKPSMVLLASALALGLNLILSIGLALVIGYAGPAWATTVSTYFHVLFLAVIIRQCLHTGFSRLFPLGELLRIAASSITAGIISYPVFYLPVPEILKIGISLIAFTGIYIIVAGKLGVIFPVKFLHAYRKDGK